MSRKTWEKKWLIPIIVLLALIVLPTGTPEDLFTTVVIIQTIGVAGYAMLALIVLLLYLAVKGGKK